MLSLAGFSRTTIELLNKLEADYSSFDILSDEEVRQGLKTYSDWPTYPQVCKVRLGCLEYFVMVDRTVRWISVYWQPQKRIGE